MADTGDLRPFVRAATCPATAPAPTGALTRRAVLGVGLAGLALVLGTRRADSAVAPVSPVSPVSSTLPGRGRPAAVPSADGARHVLFTRFEGASWRDGTHHGTTTRARELVIAAAASRRRYTDPFGDGTTVTYEQAGWVSPRVATPFGLTELIASWDVRTPGRTWVEVLVRGVDETGRLSGWYVLGRWCALDPADGGAIHRTSVDGQATDLATVWTDTFHAYSGHSLRGFQLRVALLRPLGSRDTPSVRMLGAVASALPDDPTVPVSPVGRARGVLLDVPTLSQEVHVGHYPQWDGGGEAWCSATSTAMILRYWGVGPTAADLAWVDPPVDAEVDFSARNVFDYTYDGCGNWPFNNAYAARYGLEAFVTRLRSFTELEELVRRGIPVAISVSFDKGDLDGAGYGTNGHLMVVVGFTQDGDVVVNDPASHLVADDAQVRVTYRRDQLENAWVPHSGGTVYVMHPRSVRLPAPLTPREPNW